MPSNRPHLDKETKKQKVKDAARALILRDGFDNTSMSAIAREAGITPNTIYWYYAGKDELLAAVVDELTDRLAATLEQRSAQAGLANTLQWLLTHLNSARSLATTLHDRARHSDAVAASHQRFHRIIGNTARGLLEQDGRAPTDIEAMIMIATFVLEGLLTHPMNNAQRQTILDVLQQRLLASPA